MLFNSFEFFIFSGLFFPLYFLSRGTFRLGVCLCASYLFYGWWDWRFLSLIAISTIVDYCVGLYMDRSNNVHKRRFLLMISMVSNLGILGAFKYFDFFMSSFVDVTSKLGLNFSPPVLEVILPVGISFYTFQTMSYSIDLYQRKCRVEPSFLVFATYVSLFPQLVAGPIVRAAKLLPQLHLDHTLDWARVGRGLEMIIWGFFLKICLADTLAKTVDPIYAAPENYGALAHMIGALFFTFQIYGDFCGYSLIAIGLGRIMGFDFGVNFIRPYFSKSFSDFWQRWHISLSSWLRDYLYVPLGGNRKGQFITFRNLVIVMFLGGLWHGANYTFIVWGGLHGSYLVLQNILSRTAMPLLQGLTIFSVILPLMQRLGVFLLCVLAWIYFRAENVTDAHFIIQKILTGEEFYKGATNDLFLLSKGFVMIVIVLIVDCLCELKSIHDRYLSFYYIRWMVAMGALWSIAFAGTFEGSAFIYFQF